MNDEIEIIVSEVIDGMESNSTSISMVPSKTKKIRHNVSSRWLGLAMEDVIA